MSRYLLAGLLAILSFASQADGTLTHMSGPVAVIAANGQTQAGQVGGKVLAGETVTTGPGGYVRMEMSDGSEMVLRPDSQLKIEAYKFVKDNPREDSSVFSMFKGGLRKVTGLIGKRGNQEAYKLNTPTATIGIRGTQYDLRVCQGNCGALADGTYLAVRFGAVQAANPMGTLPVLAGQVAHVPPQRPPVMLPRDPGIGFTPPAVIPKLDEKKKVQEEAKQQEQARPAEQKPASSSAAPAESKPEEGKKTSSGTAESGSKSESTGKGESGTGQGSSTSQQGGEASSSTSGSGSTAASAKTGSATSASTASTTGSTASASGTSTTTAASSSTSATGSATTTSSATTTGAAVAAPKATMTPFQPSPTQPLVGGECSVQ